MGTGKKRKAVQSGGGAPVSRGGNRKSKKVDKKILTKTEYGTTWRPETVEGKNLFQWKCRIRGWGIRINKKYFAFPMVPKMFWW